ncbi:hypothetical protein V1289_003375 [Bradyrhizobium sp. AZCC 2289]
MAKAVVSDFELGSEEQRLLGIANRIRLSAPADVVQEVEKLIRQIIAIWLKPRLVFRATASEALLLGRVCRCRWAAHSEDIWTSLEPTVTRRCRVRWQCISMGYRRVMELSFSLPKFNRHLRNRQVSVKPSAT